MINPIRAGRLLLAAALAIGGVAALTLGAASAGAAASPAGACQNVLADGDFEAALSPWFQAGQPPTVTLWTDIDPFWGTPYPFPGSTFPIRECLAGGACEVTAGYNDPAGPQAGQDWAWFGGGFTSTAAITQVTQIITQTFAAPAAHTARLEFNLWISRADLGSSAADRLEARVGGQTVFSATAAYTTPYAAGYVPISVELGQVLTTTLLLSATTRAAQVPVGAAQGPPIVNFNVDNLQICVTLAPATPTPTASPTASPTAPPPTQRVFLPALGKG